MNDGHGHPPANQPQTRTNGGGSSEEERVLGVGPGLPPGTPGNAARVLLSGAKTEATPPWGGCWWCLAVEKDAVPAQLDFRNVA